MLGLALLSWSASATVMRAAMITEAKGPSTYASKPLRTLQVLSEGSQLDVPSGARLRLVYLESGQKESVSGPCQVRIGANDSKVLSGSGKLVVEQSNKATTKVRRSENLRRMGGSLQAQVDDDLEDLIAMLPTMEPPGSRGVTIDPSVVAAKNTPQAAISVDAFKQLQWRGGTPPFRVSLVLDEQVLASAEVSERFWDLPKEVRIVPGQVYQLKVDEVNGSARMVHDFTVLLPSQRKELEASVDELAKMLGGSERDRLMAELAGQEEWGLWLEAKASAEQAVKAYPDDPGFQTVLGRTLLNLGDLEEAARVLLKAQQLESGKTG